MTDIAFTPEEQSIIDKQQVDPESPQYPKYFKTDDLTFQPISSDFEAYLILQPSDQKQTVQSWIKAVKTFNQTNTDRDIILAAYLNIRSSDAALRKGQLDSTLSNFSDFKESLAPGDDTAPSKYASVIELDLLSRALQKPIDETVMMREQAFHEENLTKQLFTVLALTKAGTEADTELTTWQSVVGTYAGQT